jgi:hypothetical protein
MPSVDPNSSGQRKKQERRLRGGEEESHLPRRSAQRNGSQQGNGGPGYCAAKERRGHAEEVLQEIGLPLEPIESSSHGRLSVLACLARTVVAFRDNNRRIQCGSSVTIPT